MISGFCVTAAIAAMAAAGFAWPAVLSGWTVSTLVMLALGRCRREPVSGPGWVTLLLGIVAMTALIPVATSLDYPTAFASVTGGRGSMSASLHSYQECPLVLGAVARRRGTDPLDTAKYILAARNALEGDIFG